MEYSHLRAAIVVSLSYYPPDTEGWQERKEILIGTVWKQNKYRSLELREEQEIIDRRQRLPEDVVKSLPEVSNKVIRYTSADTTTSARLKTLIKMGLVETRLRKITKKGKPAKQPIPQYRLRRTFEAFQLYLKLICRAQTEESYAKDVMVRRDQKIRYYVPGPFGTTYFKDMQSIVESRMAAAQKKKRLKEREEWVERLAAYRHNVRVAQRQIKLIDELLNQGRRKKAKK